MDNQWGVQTQQTNMIDVKIVPYGILAVEPPSAICTGYYTFPRRVEGHTGKTVETSACAQCHQSLVTMVWVSLSLFLYSWALRVIDPTHCTFACLSTKSITRLFNCHGNLIALTVHALQQLPSLTSLADTNYSRLKYSMLEQWSVSPSLVTHASVSMSRQRSRTKTAHVRIGGDLAKITTRCSAAGLGKVRSVVVVKTTIHQTSFRQFIVCNRTVVGNKLPGYGWSADLLQLFISEHFLICRSACQVGCASKSIQFSMYTLIWSKVISQSLLWLFCCLRAL